MTFQIIANDFSNGLIVLMVAGIPLLGFFRKVRVYDAFVDGATNSFQICLQIMPNAVGMLVAIGMFRASGAMTHFANWLAPVFSKIGVPSEILPLGLIRPFSGSAANGVMLDIIHTHGADSLLAKTAATTIGSTETTFYVLAIYFGTVGIRRVRHAVWAGLIADVVGMLAAVWICKLVFTG